MIIGESHQVLKHNQEGEGGDGTIVEGKQMVRNSQLGFEHFEFGFEHFHLFSVRF